MFSPGSVWDWLQGLNRPSYLLRMYGDDLRPLPVVHVVDSWQGGGHRYQYLEMRPRDGFFPIPCGVFDEWAQRAAILGLEVQQCHNPAWRAPTDVDWYVPILAFSKERPSLEFIDHLAAFTTVVDFKRLKHGLLAYCGYAPRAEMTRETYGGALDSPWQTDEQRFRAGQAIDEGAVYVSAGLRALMPVYSAHTVARWLEHNPRRINTGSGLTNFPWVVDEPALLEPLLPFYTDSLYYAAACAAVRYSPLYHRLRKSTPKCMQELPMIYVKSM